MLTLLLGAALASTPAELTWTITAGNTPLGTRTARVKVLTGDQGTRRVIESYTELSGTVGPVRVNWRQRLTAHAEGGTPASFHSVVDDAGQAAEIQGRWTPAGWVVATNTAGRTRSVDYAPSAIDLSTADLLDPDRRVGFHRERAKVLSDLTGEVMEGAVESLGPSELTVAGTPVPVEGIAWTGPEGRSEFWFSAEGYLVKYETRAMGIALRGELTAPPPGGVDDFAVGVGRPRVEVLPL